uniref:Uncharacterized protein n=2 Tax=Lutzomyia longipalpis TaxID=7200 RepID=A0A1B0CRX6_LUTLO
MKCPMEFDDYPFVKFRRSTRKNFRRKVTRRRGDQRNLSVCFCFEKENTPLSEELKKNKMNEERREGNGAMEKLPMAASGVEASMVAVQVVAAPTVAAPAVEAPAIETPAKAVLTAVTIGKGFKGGKMSGFALELQKMKEFVPRFELNNRRTLCVVAWLDTVSGILHQCGVKDEHVILVAIIWLKGASKPWFDRKKGYLRTWEIMEKHLRNSFRMRLTAL